MSTTPTHDQGTFIWYALRTSDVAGAQRFYGGLFGWTFTEYDVAGQGVPVALVGEHPFVMFLPPRPQDAGPQWTSSVTVLDVDEAVRNAVALGATVLDAPMDFPGHARYAVVRDPQGAAIALIRSASPSGSRPGRANPGEFGWNLLAAPDPVAARAFYTALLGWQAVETPDSPFTRFEAGAHHVAGLVASPVGPARWSACVQVRDLAATCAQAAAAGGASGAAVAVPGVGTYAVITDPTGATLCALQPVPFVPPPPPPTPKHAGPPTPADA